MTIEFNDVRLQYRMHREVIDRAIARVFDSGVFILGPQVEAFEREFAAYCGAAHGVGVASGTDAIELVLEAIGVGPGDEVIVPALTASATGLAVVARGATPVFADISEATFNIDPTSAAALRTARTRAIVAVHLYGLPAPVGELTGLGLPVIEDAAQAHGSATPAGRAGTLGLASAFSFYPTKNLGAYGDGGMVVTGDEEIASRVRLTRHYGQPSGSDSVLAGVNSRLDEMQAAILRVKLGMLDQWNTRRHEIMATYRAAFGDLPVAMQHDRDRGGNGHLFVLRTARRDELRRFLTSRNVPTLIHYPVPLHRQKAFRTTDRCPNADAIAAEIVSLPLHGHMEPSEAEYVASAVREFFTTASVPTR
jgi:dTDP-4-amino-4,6-dideoxygalactose transaminase